MHLADAFILVFRLYVCSLCFCDSICSLLYRKVLSYVNVLKKERKMAKRHEMISIPRRGFIQQNVSSTWSRLGAQGHSMMGLIRTSLEAERSVSNKTLLSSSRSASDTSPVRKTGIIVQKYSLLSFENCINLSLIKMVCKCVNNLAPEMICPLISKQSSKGITTRGATNQNCTVPKRKTKFTQSTSSVQGTLLWNSLKMQTELNICQRNLKKWFKLKPVCEHWWSYTVSAFYYCLAVVKKA